jgi:hypothetical protein
MSIFGKIKDAIFQHKSASPQSRPQIPAGMAGGPPLGSSTQAAPVDVGQSTTTAPAPAQQQAVDVDQVLSTMAQEQGNPDLNYKTSIVDLMKLLGLDSSLDNRKQLATELGYTGATDGSAEMNMWLSKAVMKELANNGGNVSANLMA